MRTAPLLLASSALLLALTGSTPPAPPHCRANAKVTPVAGDPGWFWIETSHGRWLARNPAAPAPDAAPDFVIEALDMTWESDNDPNTVVDTLVVPAGSRVRWQLVTGIHTLTNGRDDMDPEAGTRFDYLLDEQHPTFDSTFVVPDALDFFCDFHLPWMVGTLIVTSGDTPARTVTLGAVKRRWLGR